MKVSTTNLLMFALKDCELQENVDFFVVFVYSKKKAYNFWAKDTEMITFQSVFYGEKIREKEGWKLGKHKSPETRWFIIFISFFCIPEAWEMI